MLRTNLNTNNDHYRIYQEYKSRLEMFENFHEFFITAWNYIVQFSIVFLSLSTGQIILMLSLNIQQMHLYFSYLINFLCVVSIVFQVLFFICILATQSNMILYKTLLGIIHNGHERGDTNSHIQNQIDETIKIKHKNLFKLIFLYRCQCLTTFCFLLCGVCLMILYY